MKKTPRSRYKKRTQKTKNKSEMSNEKAKKFILKEQKDEDLGKLLGE